MAGAYISLARSSCEYFLKHGALLQQKRVAGKAECSALAAKLSWSFPRTSLTHRRASKNGCLTLQQAMQLVLSVKAVTVERQHQASTTTGSYMHSFKALHALRCVERS